MESLLASMGSREQAALQQVGRRRRFSRAEVVFHEGDPGDCLHVVTDGMFIARSVSTRGDVVAVNTFRGGTVFGELALLSASHRRSATVAAVRSAATLMVMRDDFEQLRARDPSVDRLLVAMLAERNRQLNARLLELLFLPVEKRVYRRLLAFAGDSSDIRTGWVDIGQGELAELAATTRPTANRALRRAQDAGLVDLARGRVRIVDVAGLTRCAT